MPSFTPNLNLYLPGGGSESIGGADEAADVDKLNKNFQKIDTALGVSDTGWVTVAQGFLSGFTPSANGTKLAYRVRDGVVYWRGGVDGVFPPGYTKFVENLPTAVMPEQFIRVGGGSSGGNPVFIEISPVGYMNGAHNSGANRVWVDFATSYPARP